MYRVLLATVLITGLALTTPAAEVLKFVDEQPIDVDGIQGRLELELSGTALEAGRSGEFRYTYTNTAGGCRVSNPFFHGLLPYPGQLALYDDSFRYVCDLLEQRIGSRASMSERYMVVMGAGSFVGATVRFRVFGRAGMPLEPGRYYVQLVMMRGFVAEDGVQLPIGDGTNPAPVMHEVIGRSNAVPVEIRRS